LEKGNEVILTVKDLAGAPNQRPVDYKRLPESVTPGSLIFLNDGFIQLQVEKVSGEEVFCRTVIGGPLLSYKGLNLPGVKILADAVSDTDLEFVALALQEGVDAFGVSFVEEANNFLTLSYGVHPVNLDYETNDLADMAMQFMDKAGMIEKGERVILVEDELTKDMHGTDSLKIISA
jgi:pyruvate kinase